MQRQEAYDVAAWRNAHAHPSLPVPAGAAGAAVRWMSLFCYEPAALPQWLQLCEAASTPTHLLVAPGRPAHAVRQALGISSKNVLQGTTDKRGQLYISYRTPCPQAVFDEMLWACDLNAVRGEDSLVRGLWAGKALIWHIYPQDDDAHHAKLQAFLDWLQAPHRCASFTTPGTAWMTCPCSGPMTARCANGRPVCSSQGPTADAGQIPSCTAFRLRNGKTVKSKALRNSYAAHPCPATAHFRRGTCTGGPRLHRRPVRIERPRPKQSAMKITKKSAPASASCTARTPWSS